MTGSQTEKIVREYFESRADWTVTKLDLGKGDAADFRVCYATLCFLCEVKTIQSVRANFPATPWDFYLEQRKKQQAKIREWTEENPDKRLILPPDDWEFICGDEIEFAEKYHKRRRNTEMWFREFAKTMRDHLFNSIIKDLPYSLRLDSDDLYAPNLAERKAFFRWIEEEVQAISIGHPSRHWHIQEPRYGNIYLYSTFYPIHVPADKDDVKAEYQLTIEGPRSTGGLEVNSYSYGGLNLDAITRNVEGGLGQLEMSVSREKDSQIPRIIVLAFESGIGSEWQELSSHIVWLLKTSPELSAIAILDWIPDGIPPSPEQGLSAWAEFHAKTPIVPRFLVYHNSSLQDVKPLRVDVFSDKWSVQRWV